MKHALIFLLVTFLGTGGEAMASETVPAEVVPATGEEQEFIDIAKDLRCPTCTGLSILDSDAPFSNQIKNEVKEQLKQGKPQAEIMAFFTERYGPWILREPPKSGANLLAWIIPGALLFLGPVVMWLLVWRRKKTFASYGVRSTEDILAEFHQSLEGLRRARPATDSAREESGS